MSLDHLSINVITPKQTGGTPVNAIARESSSPKNALAVSIEVGVVDALGVSFNTSTKDMVLAPFPSRTGRGDQHEDDSGRLNMPVSTRRENPGIFSNTIKRVDTNHGEIVTVIIRESSSPKNALDIGLLSSAYDGLDVGLSISDYANAAGVTGFTVDPYGPHLGPVHMYVDAVGNTISDQKSRGGAG